MIKALKIIGIFILVSFVAGCSIFVKINEPKPAFNLETQAEADVLGHRMLKAINYLNWENTIIVKWSFKDHHHFVWDKQNNFVQVKWKKNDVRLNLDSLDQFVVYKDEVKVKDLKTARDLKTQAWEYFCNDSFWLNAPAKIFDNGTTRTIVEEEGNKRLLVTYASGGATPGDSYLWYLDENDLPYKYKMWVSIIPFGGAEATWAKWQKTPSGAKLATEHEMAIFKILIKNISTAKSLEDMGKDALLFSAFNVL